MAGDATKQQVEAALNEFVTVLKQVTPYLEKVDKYLVKNKL